MSNEQTELTAHSQKSTELLAAAKLAARKIISAYYPNPKDISAEFVGTLVVALAEFPPWAMEMISHPVHGVAGREKFLTIAAIVEMGNDLLAKEREMEERRRRSEAPPEPPKIALPLGAYRDMTKLSAEEVAKRKATVMAELGYDPSKGRPPAWCFPRPDIPFDVSDFPEQSGHVHSVEPQPSELRKASANKPWHDPEELRRSMQRIKHEMAGENFLHDPLDSAD